MLRRTLLALLPAGLLTAKEGEPSSWVIRKPEYRPGEKVWYQSWHANTPVLCTVETFHHNFIWFRDPDPAENCEPYRYYGLKAVEKTEDPEWITTKFPDKSGYAHYICPEDESWRMTRVK